MAEEVNVIQKVNKALGEYYASLKDDTFYKDNPNGKFWAFCVCLCLHSPVLEAHNCTQPQEENGTDDPDVLEDDMTAGDAVESLYVDFDDKFPFAPDTDVDVEDDEQRQKAIYDVIKYCYDNGRAPPTGPDTVNLDLNVNSSHLQRAERPVARRGALIGWSGNQRALQNNLK